MRILVFGMMMLFFCFKLKSQTISMSTGGGNLNNGAYNLTNLLYADILESTGAKMVRVNLYPNDYWDFANDEPRTNYADLMLLHLAEKNIQVVFLFEHYASFVSLGQPLGDYSKWHQIGAAFADRYQPGSAFFASNGYPNYGVIYYTAINEPDIGGYMPLTIADGPENYHDAIEGLADGVHSVNSQMKVIPGGFASENAALDHTLNGFGTAIADLFNNGKLYGIDLHTYNDVSYAPILKYDNTNHEQFMAYYDFYEVKQGCGITADIKFCPTEFGFKENTQNINDVLAAKRLLTCIWGNLGTVANDGFSRATEYALIWNLYNLVLDDPIYGMCLSQSPYVPTLKGKTFNLVLDLANDMEFVKLDPFDRGEYILIGSNKKMWVLQNYNLLSSIYGSSYTINQIPVETDSIKVYDWQGKVSSIQYSGAESVTIDGLNVNETYMIVAESNTPLASLDVEKQQLKVYPNPAQNVITLELENDFTPTTISVINLQGKTIMQQSWSGSKKCNLVTGNWSPGTYIIRLFDSANNETIVQKVTIND